MMLVLTNKLRLGQYRPICLLILFRELVDENIMFSRKKYLTLGIIASTFLMVITYLFYANITSYYEVALELIAVILLLFILIRAKEFISSSRLMSLGFLFLILSHLFGVIIEVKDVVELVMSWNVRPLLVMDAFYLVGLILLSIGLHRTVLEYIAHSNYDELTGLSSRNRLKNISLDKSEVNVIYIDLDDLKKVNDIYGHVAGDEYIIKFSEVLKMSKYPSERIRIGGDEFVIFCDTRSTPLFLEELKRQCEKINVNFSFGTALVAPENLAESVNSADKEMYKMKKSKK